MKTFIKITGLGILLFAFVSCAPYGGVSSSTASEIPLYSTKMIVKNGKTAQDNYNYCLQLLSQWEWIVEKSNESTGFISATKSTSSNIHSKVNFFIHSESISITSEWKSSQEATTFSSLLVGMPVSNDWQLAKWTNRNDRASAAFGSARMFARALGDEITYVK